MKKWLLAILAILIISLGLIYLLIPAQIAISRHIMVVCPGNAADRFLTDGKNWKLWWPGEVKPAQVTSSRSSGVMQFNGYNYQLTRSVYQAYEVSISEGSFETNSLLTIVPLSVDSVAIEWKAYLNPTFNPYKRVKKYLRGRSIATNMRILLDSLDKFISIRTNQYGFNIGHAVVEDLFLVSNRKQFSAYPSNAEIYELIAEVETFIKKENVRQTNPPMMHVKLVEGGKFELMTALPIDREIPNNGQFFFKRMVKGNLLMSEFTGGPVTAGRGLEAMEYFKSDYKLVSPAIPYFSLVTDRRIEKDSARWVTRLYYPIL